MESKPKQIVNFNLTPEGLKSFNEVPKYVKVAMKTLALYESGAQYIPEKMAKNYESVDPKYLARLPFNYKDKVELVKKCLKTNQEFFNLICNAVGPVFDNERCTEEDVSSYNMQEAGYLRKYYFGSLVCEWGDNGNEEREVYINHIVNEIKKYYDYENKDIISGGEGVKILYPFCHLGRLGYELLKKGYKVELNGNSIFNQLVMDYFFNKAKKYECDTVPRIHTFCSSFTAESVTRIHKVPNVEVKEELKDIKEGNGTYVPGDFAWHYKDVKEKFDAVVTLFGIEENRNVIEVVETISRVLKKGGVWVNFGGMDYAYSGYVPCYDLCWDELRKVIQNYDFEIKNEENKFVAYGKMDGCSLPYTCGAVIFTAVKK